MIKSRLNNRDNDQLIFALFLFHFPPQKHRPGMLPVDPKDGQVLEDCAAFDSSLLIMKMESERPKRTPIQNNGDVLELCEMSLFMSWLSDNKIGDLFLSHAGNTFHA